MNSMVNYATDAKFEAGVHTNAAKHWLSAASTYKDLLSAAGRLSKQLDTAHNGRPNL